MNIQIFYIEKNRIPLSCLLKLDSDKGFKNMKINLDEHKERHEIEAPKGTKIALCRCWKSKIFPKCDGAHRAHNKENNDNVGPVVVSDLNEK